MPHRSIDIPADTPVEEHENAPEFERAVKHAREFMQKGDYEFPYTMLQYIRQKEPERLDAAATALIPDMLGDVSKSDFQVYRSLRDSATVRAKYITRDVDASLRYKFDLIRELELPPQTQEAIVSRSLEHVFTELERAVGNGGYDRGYRSSYQRSPLEDSVQRICEILHQMPFRDATLLQPFQARYRALAAPLLVSAHHSGLYYLQNLGIVLRLPWHTEYKSVHAPRAIDLLLESFPEVPVYDKTRVIRSVLELQQDTGAPVTPERKRGAIALLKDCIGHNDEMPQQLIAAFGIDRETVLTVARSSAVEYMQRHESVHPKDRSAWFPEQMVRAYGVRLQDMPLAERERTRCVQEVLSLPQPQERQRAAADFVARAEREHTAYLLPLALAGELSRSLSSPDDGSIPRLLQAFAHTPATKEFLDQAVRMLFADTKGHAPALSLRDKGSQHLWLYLVKDPECAAFADLALDAFAVQQGLDAARMRQMWSLSSNDRPDYSEAMGTRVVQAKNIAAMAALERRAPGAPGYFQRQWNMHMFSRYPTEVLAQIHGQELARKGMLGEPRSKPRKTLLVLFPAADWNGAFDNQPLIDHIAKEAAAKGFDMHIAEADSRMAAIRALVRCSRRHGPVDVCIFGGHASKDSLSLGADELGKIRTEHFAFTRDEDGKAVSSAQLQRLRQYCSPSCRFIFKACSVGQEGGLAQVISQTMNVTAVAADVPTGLASVDLTQGTARYSKNVQAREYQQPRPPPRTFLQRLWQRLRGKKGS